MFGQKSRVSSVVVYWFAFASVLMACVESPAPSLCGDAQEVNANGQTYCVYGVVVTGFSCPDGVFRRVELAQVGQPRLTVCTNDELVGADALRRLIDEQSAEPTALICEASYNSESAEGGLAHQELLCGSRWVIRAGEFVFRISAPELRRGVYQLVAPDESVCSDTNTAVGVSFDEGSRTVIALGSGAISIDRISGDRIEGSVDAFQGRSGIRGTFELESECVRARCADQECAPGTLCVDNDGVKSCVAPQGPRCNEVRCSALGCSDGAFAGADGIHYCLNQPWMPPRYTH